MNQDYIRNIFNIILYNIRKITQKIGNEVLTSVSVSGRLHKNIYATISIALMFIPGF